MLTLERIDPTIEDWRRMDAHPDRLLFQTKAWVDFVAGAQGAVPIVAEVRDGGQLAGWFTGLVVRRFGIPILGSPFPGWTTSSMGFTLEDGVDRRDASLALERFAFGPARVLHFEFKDRRIESAADLAGLGFSYSPSVTYEIDLTLSESELFERMTSACRRAIRKSEKEGVRVEVAEPDGFAEDYFAQLEDVFAKQGLTPTYGADRVKLLVDHLAPAGNLLLLRARDRDGRSIATALFPGLNGTAYFWGGASWRQGQIVRPNEAIFWAAIRIWKERGARTLDLGGGGDYKLKYGPSELSIPWFRKSRIPGLMRLRDLAAGRLSPD
jgi:CelD/BcsL family acetyltransferase involved in cellulose biosynthesis